jgi:hypothetical protein
MLVVMLESFGLDTMIWSPWNYNPVGPAMNHPPNAAAVPPKSSWAREEKDSDPGTYFSWITQICSLAQTDQK